MASMLKIPMTTKKRVGKRIGNTQDVILRNECHGTAERKQGSLLEQKALEFYQSGIATDVTVRFTDSPENLIVGNELSGRVRKLSFDCHKLILATYSENLNLYFSKVAKNDAHELKINSNVISPEHFALVLDFLYRGEVPVPRAILKKLYRCACKLQIDCLVKGIRQHLRFPTTVAAGSTAASSNKISAVDTGTGVSQSVVVNVTKKRKMLKFIPNGDKEENSKSGSSGVVQEEVPTTSRNMIVGAGLVSETPEIQQPTEEQNTMVKKQKSEKRSLKKEKDIRKKFVTPLTRSRIGRGRLEKQVSPSIKVQKRFLPLEKEKGTLPTSKKNTGAAADLDSGSTDATGLNMEEYELEPGEVIELTDGAFVNLPIDDISMDLPKRKTQDPRGRGKMSNDFSNTPPPSYDVAPCKRIDKAINSELAKFSRKIMETPPPPKFSQRGRLIKPNVRKMSPEPGPSREFLIAKLGDLAGQEFIPQLLGVKEEAKIPKLGNVVPKPIPKPSSSTMVAKVVEVPKWKIITDADELYVQSDTPAPVPDTMSDEAFSLRHRKFEVKEKQQKRWEMQSIRSSTMKKLQEERGWQKEYGQFLCMYRKRGWKMFEKREEPNPAPKLENVFAVYVGKVLPKDVLEHELPPDED